MLGKRLEKRIETLDAIAARLEAAAARLENQDPLAVWVSPAVRDAVVCAANAALTHVLVDVRAAVVAGERDQAALFRAAHAPLIRALAAVPAPQMASALLTANTTLLSRLIDHLLAGAPMLSALQTFAEDQLRGEPQP